LSVRAIANRADPHFHAEGNYSALVEFEGGLASAIREDRAPFPDGNWGKATLEVCLGLLESTQGSRDVRLHYQ
jgi:hypothetical protein